MGKLCPVLVEPIRNCPEFVGGLHLGTSADGQCINHFISLTLWATPNMRSARPASRDRVLVYVRLRRTHVTGW